eukprot:1140640-Pelagomonas_calceolata.AAC.5
MPVHHADAPPCPPARHVICDVILHSRSCAGGSPARVEAANAIVEAGVAVMGHVGLTPQSISVIGG